MYGYTQNKEDYLKRLRRIEGQIRGLQRMVEDDKYCIDILTQVAAATKALQSVALGLLEEHLGHCVAGAIAEGVTPQPRRSAKPPTRSPAWSDPEPQHRDRQRPCTCTTRNRSPAR